jgi:DegV family protein with EDD domain
MRGLVAPVKIVTDSSVFLPDSDLAAKLGIEVLPLTVRVGDQSYPERAHVIDEGFLRKMTQNGISCAVEAPSVGQIRRAFERLTQTADKIVCIHVSGALNDIAQVVERASQSFAGRQRIIVIDTLTTSVGLGLIVEAAARAAADGAPLAEVVRIVRGMVPHMYALFFSDSLQYLEAWGRLGPAQTALGTMLNLKPISTMEDGDLLPIEKVRSYQRAVDKLHDFIIEFSHIEQMYLLQNGFETEAAQLLERLELAYPGREFPVIGFGPSLAVHIGPKALGIMVYEGDR